MPTLVPRSTEIIYSPGRIFSNLNLPPKNLQNNLVVVRVVCNVFSSVSNNITSASGTITPLPYAAFPSIVNFSSVQAYRGDPLPQDAYSQSKAAVLNLSKSIAMQFADKNIRANTIVPGMTMTPLQKRWEGDEISKQKMADYIPLKRLGTPNDMSDGVLLSLIHI